MPGKQSSLNTESLVSLISRLNRLFNHSIEASIATLDLSIQEFRITGLLLGEAGISQKQLAQKLSVKPSTLSVALDRLEAKGVIHRVAHESDQRIKLLQLNSEFDPTPAQQLLEDFEQKITQGISKADLITTVNVLAKISQSLQLERRKS